METNDETSERQDCLRVSLGIPDGAPAPDFGIHPPASEAKLDRPPYGAPETRRIRFAMTPGDMATREAPCGGIARRQLDARPTHHHGRRLWVRPAGFEPAAERRASGG